MYAAGRVGSGAGRVGPTGPAGPAEPPQRTGGHQYGEPESPGTHAPGCWDGPWLGTQPALVAP